KIHVRSKLHYFSLIKDRLNEARCSLFRTTCFGPWLDISYVENDDAFIEDEEKFSKVSDEDAIRLCLLLSLENSFPWDEHIWRQLYDSIRNVCSKHKLEHLDGLRKNLNHVPSYTLSGFLFAFKMWIIESSYELHRWWTRVREIIPGALSWTRTAECLKWEYFAELFNKTPIELSPTKAERQPRWHTPSNDFLMWYAPKSPPVSIGGVYWKYLNKRSTLRVKQEVLCKVRGEIDVVFRDEANATDPYKVVVLVG
nr:hypothetical protein [Tanacetum cinerariifolium]